MVRMRKLKKTPISIATLTLVALALLATGARQPPGDWRRTVLPAPADTTCSTDSTLCLSQGRFLVQANWAKPDGESGIAHAVAITPDSGYFWFLEPGNIELAVKTLNGCSVNQHYWFFSGGLTNLAVTITVTDTTTNQVRTYTSPQGTAFRPVADINAFASCAAGCGRPRSSRGTDQRPCRARSLADASPPPGLRLHGHRSLHRRPLHRRGELADGVRKKRRGSRRQPHFRIRLLLVLRPFKRRGDRQDPERLRLRTGQLVLRRRADDGRCQSSGHRCVYGRGPDLHEFGQLRVPSGPGYEGVRVLPDPHGHGNPNADGDTHAHVDIDSDPNADQNTATDLDPGAHADTHSRSWRWRWRWIVPSLLSLLSEAAWVRFLFLPAKAADTHANIDAGTHARADTGPTEQL